MTQAILDRGGSHIVPKAVPIMSEVQRSGSSRRAAISFQVVADPVPECPTPWDKPLLYLNFPSPFRSGIRAPVLARTPPLPLLRDGKQR